MRSAAPWLALTAVLTATSARAQESTIHELTPGQPTTPPSTTPPPSTSTPSSTPWGTSTPPATSTITDPTAPPPVSLAPVRLTVTQEWNDRWHRSRAVYAAGGVIGLLGTGLTLASVVAVAITGYPCDPFDPSHAGNPMDTCNPNAAIFHPSSPTNAAPMLAYLGSSLSAVGFVFSAAGLGWQHQLLAEANVDPGRGLFTGGTVLGVLGFASVGASYFFGFTNYLNSHDQGLAILATTLTGAGLCALGSLLYLIDSSRTKKAWERLTTF